MGSWWWASHLFWTDVVPIATVVLKIPLVMVTIPLGAIAGFVVGLKTGAWAPFLITLVGIAMTSLASKVEPKAPPTPSEGA